MATAPLASVVVTLSLRGRRIRGTVLGMLASVAMAVLSLHVAQCGAQTVSDRWTAGMGMQAPVPPEWALTAHVARAINSRVGIPLRIEGSIAISAHRIAVMCLDNPCRTWRAGQTVEFAVLANKFSPPLGGAGELGVLAGGGLFLSHAASDAADGHGFGPSGLLLEGGIALRRIQRQPVALEALVRWYSDAGNGSKPAFAARIARLF